MVWDEHIATGIVYWGHIGVYRDYRVYIGVILGLYKNNGTEHGNYYIVYWGFIGRMYHYSDRYYDLWVFLVLYLYSTLATAMAATRELWREALAHDNCDLVGVLHVGV